MRTLPISFRQMTTIVMFISVPTTHAQGPDGFVPYDAHKAEFTISLPQGWTAYTQPSLVGQPGMIIFTPSSPEGLAVEEQILVMTKMDTGEVPNFFLERGSAKRGMTCASLTDRAQKEIAKLVQRSFSPGSKVESPRVEPVTVGGCNGVRVQVNARSKTGTEWTTDVRAASDGNTLYLFTLRSHRANFEKNLEFFDSAISTLRLAAAPLPTDGSGKPGPTLEVPGTAADSQLQLDISRRLSTDEPTFPEDCTRTVLKAEAYGEGDRSLIVAGMGAEAQELEGRLRAAGDMHVEKWFLQSCDVISTYEVLLTRRPEGGTLIQVKKLGDEGVAQR